MEPYQDRVLNEKAELDAKLGKLQAFLNTSTFGSLDVDEQERLRKQAGIMQEYSAVLADRLAHF
jgi:hypothetical protein